VCVSEIIMCFGKSKTVLKFLQAAARLRSFEVVVCEGAPLYVCVFCVLFCVCVCSIVCVFYCIICVFLGSNLCVCVLLFMYDNVCASMCCLQ